MKPTIRATLTQIGLHVAARRDHADPWITVELKPYRERSRFSAPNKKFTFIDPTQDREEYFEQLDARGIKYLRDDG